MYRAVHNIYLLIKVLGTNIYGEKLGKAVELLKPLVSLPPSGLDFRSRNNLEDRAQTPINSRGKKDWGLAAASIQQEDSKCLLVA